MGSARHNRHARRAAFTIAEVAFAVIVLALGIVTAISAMQRAYLELDTARALEIAANVLQSEMEKERLMDWTHVSDATYKPTIDSTFLRDPAVAARFTLSRAVAVVADHNGQMVQVTLTVTWRTFDGRTLSRNYLTYFCQGGLYNYIYKNV